MKLWEKRKREYMKIKSHVHQNVIRTTKKKEKNKKRKKREMKETINKVEVACS